MLQKTLSCVISLLIKFKEYTIEMLTQSDLHDLASVSFIPILGENIAGS